MAPRIHTLVVELIDVCNLNCAYCLRDEGALHGRPHALPVALLEKTLADLKTRTDRCNVVFTGGEPTSDPALGNAMDEVRAQGFSVGLHTAGPYPRRLRPLLSRCDWVGFDVKAPFDRYDSVTGARRSAIRVQESLDALAASGVAYETRTTWHPSLLDENALLRIADDLAALGVRRHALQAFRALGCEDESLCTAPRAGPSEALLGALASRFPQFTYRPAQ